VVAIGHVGDSRAYRVRDGELTQLTDDHSLVGELVRSGRLTTEEAEQHPHRSVITRAVGTEASVEVDTLTLELAAGDLYLICSDGLTDVVRDSEIAAVLAAHPDDLDGAAAGLVAAANAGGGIDNITVVLFEIFEGDPLSRSEAEEQPALDPDEDTAERSVAPALPVQPLSAPVQRHGAKAGGRWLALAAILIGLAAAVLVIWWSIGR
jgi:PPM family protein phosphatase